MATNQQETVPGQLTDQEISEVIKSQVGKLNGLIDAATRGAQLRVEVGVMERREFGVRFPIPTLNVDVMRVLCLVFLCLFATACVDGVSPSTPVDTHVEAKVLHQLVSGRQQDTLRLMDDMSFQVKSSGSHFWVIGRYWFGPNVNGVNRLCALPNSIPTHDDYLDCDVWEPAPGILMDPFSAFLRDGAVKQWERVR